MHAGQVSQVEEEPRSLGGFRAKSNAHTHHSRDLTSLRITCFLRATRLLQQSVPQAFFLDRIKRDTAFRRFGVSFLRSESVKIRFR